MLRHLLEEALGEEALGVVEASTVEAGLLLEGLLVLGLVQELQLRHLHPAEQWAGWSVDRQHMWRVQQTKRRLGHWP